MSDRAARLALIVVLLFGFGLRAHQLDRKGLHLDEAGQAWAATQPTLAEMVAVERTHVMAMPLDYLITRATSSFNDADFVLRLPSVVWSTLSISLLYALTRLLTGRRTEAVLAALLLATSPLYLIYAQALRFYAALGAFYLLSCLLLYRALRRPGTGRWAAFGVATLVGTYFHPFVLTALLNGAAYFLLAGLTRPAHRAALRAFILVSLLVGALFLPGFLVFGLQPSYGFDAFQYGGSLQYVVLGGLDWTTTLAVDTGPLATAWRWSNAVFAALGVVWLIARRRPMPLSLPLGALLSVGLILAAVVARGYWLMPRQLFHLSQIGMFLVAVGMGGVVRPLTGGRRAARLVVLAALAVAIVAAAQPTLQAYFTTFTSTGREPAQALLAHYQPGAAAYVIPDYEWQTVQYYLNRPAAIPADIQLQPTTAEELAATAATGDGTLFLVLLAGSPEEVARYSDMGFRVIYDDPTIRGRRHMLLVRDGTS